MKHYTYNGRLTAEERETVLVYSDSDRKWRAETSIPKHYRKMLRQNWKQTSLTTNENGDFVAAEFENTEKAVSFRDTTIKRSPMSEEHKQKLAEYRKTVNQVQK